MGVRSCYGRFEPGTGQCASRRHRHASTVENWRMCSRRSDVSVPRSSSPRRWSDSRRSLRIRVAPTMRSATSARLSARCGRTTRLPPGTIIAICSLLTDQPDDAIVGPRSSLELAERSGARTTMRSPRHCWLTSSDDGPRRVDQGAARRTRRRHTASSLPAGRARSVLGLTSSRHRRRRSPCEPVGRSRRLADRDLADTDVVARTRSRRSRPAAFDRLDHVPRRREPGLVQLDQSRRTTTRSCPRSRGRSRSRWRAERRSRTEAGIREEAAREHCPSRSARCRHRFRRGSRSSRAAPSPHRRRRAESGRRRRSRGRARSSSTLMAGCSTTSLVAGGSDEPRTRPPPTCSRATTPCEDGQDGDQDHPGRHRLILIPPTSTTSPSSASTSSPPSYLTPLS